MENRDYYQGDSGKCEAIEVIEAHNLNFSLGNCIKYVLRAGKKNTNTKKKDLSKAIWYLEREIKNL